MSKIAVLLASYDGARHISEQIESILKQTTPPWRVLISDDGSTDDTPAILERYRAAHPDLIEVLEGPREGSTPNFLSLLSKTPAEADYFCFADQDDVWYADKLERALAALATFGETQTPLLYGARTCVTNAQGDKLRLSVETKGPLNMQHALLQSFAGGNTLVMNRAALHVAQKYLQAAWEIPAHDWWFYQLVCATGGTVLYDPEPVLDYRQHEGNVIGDNKGLIASATRVKWMFSGRYRGWLESNLKALDALKDDMTPNAAALVDGLAQARQMPLLARIRKIRELGLRRQGRIGMAGFWIAVLLNRV